MSLWYECVLWVWYECVCCGYVVLWVWYLCLHVLCTCGLLLKCESFVVVCSYEFSRVLCDTHTRSHTHTHTCSYPWFSRMSRQPIITHIHTHTHISTQILNAIVQQRRPSLEGTTCPAGYRALIEDCWKEEPDQRPDFAEVWVCVGVFCVCLCVFVCVFVCVCGGGSSVIRMLGVCK